LDAHWLCVPAIQTAQHKDEVIVYVASLLVPLMTYANFRGEPPPKLIDGRGKLGSRNRPTHGHSELKALYAKAVSLARLSGADLAVDEAGYVVFDGNRLRSCRDATAAINVVCHAKRWCSTVDLAAIRRATA
jgi:hypothetical protein